MELSQAAKPTVWTLDNILITTAIYPLFTYMKALTFPSVKALS